MMIRYCNTCENIKKCIYASKSNVFIPSLYSNCSCSLGSCIECNKIDAVWIRCKCDKWGCTTCQLINCKICDKKMIQCGYCALSSFSNADVCEFCNIKYCIECKEICGELFVHPKYVEGYIDENITTNRPLLKTKNTINKNICEGCHNEKYPNAKPFKVTINKLNVDGRAHDNKHDNQHDDENDIHIKQPKQPNSHKTFKQWLGDEKQSTDFVDHKSQDSSAFRQTENVLGGNINNIPTKYMLQTGNYNYKEKNSVQPAKTSVIVFNNKDTKNDKKNDKIDKTLIDFQNLCMGNKQKINRTLITFDKLQKLSMGITDNADNADNTDYTNRIDNMDNMDNIANSEFIPDYLVPDRNAPLNEKPSLQSHGIIVPKYYPKSRICIICEGAYYEDLINCHMCCQFICDYCTATCGICKKDEVCILCIGGCNECNGKICNTCTIRCACNKLQVCELCYSQENHKDDEICLMCKASFCDNCEIDCRCEDIYCEKCSAIKFGEYKTYMYESDDECDKFEEIYNDNNNDNNDNDNNDNELKIPLIKNNKTTSIINNIVNDLSKYITDIN